MTANEGINFGDGWVIAWYRSMSFLNFDNWFTKNGHFQSCVQKSVRKKTLNMFFFGKYCFNHRTIANLRLESLREGMFLTCRGWRVFSWTKGSERAKERFGAIPKHIFTMSTSFMFPKSFANAHIDFWEFGVWWDYLVGIVGLSTSFGIS